MPTRALRAPAAPASSLPAAATGSRAEKAAALTALLAAKAVAGWGVQWDIRWHLLIGRDSFWIAPAGGLTVLGLTGSPGWHLAWWGIALTVLAAPVDDLWHRLFGLDVTLWSPPHLLGILGAQVNTLGTLLIALEVCGIALDEGVQTAFRHGGLLFFTWPVLGGLAFALGLLVLGGTLLARLPALAHALPSPAEAAAAAVLAAAGGLGAGRLAARLADRLAPAPTRA